MCSEIGPGPAEASQYGQGLPKFPPEIHQMIFNAIDKPNDRARTTLSVMLANKELHGIWKWFLYEDNINNGGSSALMHAVLHGHKQPLREIIGLGTTAEGKSVNMDVCSDALDNKNWWFDPTNSGNDRDRKKRLTPLHVAVVRGDEETVLLLLENGADVNAKGYTLHHNLEASIGSLPIVEALISNNSTILSDPEEPEGFSVLHTAAICGHEHLVKFFITEGLIPVDRKAPYLAGIHKHKVPLVSTAAHCAARSVPGWKTLWLFRDLGADMNLVVLSFLREPSDTTMAIRLLNESSWTVDLNTSIANLGKYEPIFDLATNVMDGNVDVRSLADAILEVHLEQEIEAHDMPGWRLILQTALDSGANVNRCYGTRNSGIQESVLRRCLTNIHRDTGWMLMKMLLERRARVYTCFPLENVEDHGNSMLLRYLSFLTFSDRSILEKEMEQGSTDRAQAVERKMKALLATGIRLDGTIEAGWTCLFFACRLVTRYQYPLEIMRMLLDAGANPNQSRDRSYQGASSVVRGYGPSVGGTQSREMLLLADLVSSNVDLVTSAAAAVFSPSVSTLSRLLNRNLLWMTHNEAQNRHHIQSTFPSLTRVQHAVNWERLL
ncbi:hypothetical protein PG988_001486 [Apiospora saccharicola]